MAKMFYTLDETRAALGRSEDEIKQLAREGRLREFRDGPRLMFKADQVEQLKGELDSGLEGVGSGSGLLDLTRESDDTSLGAVLDEITPSRGGRGGTMSGGDAGLVGF